MVATNRRLLEKSAQNQTILKLIHMITETIYNFGGQNSNKNKHENVLRNINFLD